MPPLERSYHSPARFVCHCCSAALLAGELPGPLPLLHNPPALGEARLSHQPPHLLPVPDALPSAPARLPACLPARTLRLAEPRSALLVPVLVLVPVSVSVSICSSSVPQRPRRIPKELPATRPISAPTCTLHPAPALFSHDPQRRPHKAPPAVQRALLACSRQHVHQGRAPVQLRPLDDRQGPLRCIEKCELRRLQRQGGQTR